MISYKFVEGSKIKGIKAEETGKELKRIYGKFSLLTPKIIIQESRPKESKLHKAFEWNDRIAGELFREEQARCLIRSVRVLIDNEDDSEPVLIRAYLNVNQDDENRYIASRDVMMDDELRNQVLEKAKNDLKSWRERYQDLNELKNIFDMIDQLEMEAVN